MFLSTIKKIGLLCCITLVSSCSLFSEDKDIPEGKRISIIDSHYNTDANLTPKTAEIPPLSAESQWSQSGGNSVHVMGNLSGNDNIKKLWSSDFGKGENKRNLLLAQPVITGSHVYTQDVEGTVSAFNLNNGQKIWKRKIKPQNKNSADNGLNGVGIATDGNSIFAVTGYGSILSFDAKSGKQLWRIETNNLIRTAPNVCSDKLIIQTLDNRLLVLSTKDGSEIFKYNTSAEDTVLAGGATPACSDSLNIIIAGFSNGQIEAFNADIGYPLWSANLINAKRGNSTTNINAIKASPIIDNEKIYAIGNNDMLISVDYRTGETLWSQEIGSINTPWLAGNYLYVVSNNNTLVCLNKNSGEIMYTSKLLQEYDLKDRTDIFLTGPIMVNNKLLVSASNGIIYVISPLNGEIKHKFDTKDEIPYSPISAQDTVIITNSDAQITAYK